MTHLKIEQNTTGTEEVNSSIIAKLYELASSGDLDNTSNLKGRLHSTTGYVSHVNYLNTNFQDLIIQCDNLYVEFQDPIVSSILATNFGDGVGITQATVNSMTSFNGKFSNSSIVTFNELSQFPNITEINQNNRFNSCTSLTSIDLSNITKISGANGYERWNFENCANLTNVGDTSNVTYFGQGAFSGCSRLEHVDISSAITIGNNTFFDSKITFSTFPTSIQKIGDSAFLGKNVHVPATINLPNLTEIGNNAFGEKSDIINIVDLGTITTLGTGANGYERNPFCALDNLETAIIPETVTGIGWGFANGSNVRWIKILSDTVPTLYAASNTFGTEVDWSSSDRPIIDKRSYPIYVKDNLVTSYQSATNWNKITSSRFKPLSQFATDFPNE